jgi:hypothetical protein
LIALTDHTDIGGLARSAGFDDVRPENRASLRRLHGTLMKRLATSGLRVLVWDIRFGAESEFDGDLVGGVQAVAAHGADVVVSAADWKLSEAGLPTLSPALLPYVKWGATTADFARERPWSLDLLVQRAGRDAMPSLALLAVTSYRRPGSEAMFLVNPARQRVTLCYWKPVPSAPRARRWTEFGETLRLTGIWPLRKDDDTFGLRRDDLIGHYFVTIPPDSALQRCTLEYQDVFAADEPQLRRWLTERVVIVADLRAGIDRHPYPDGRQVPGAYGHAAAIESLLRSVAIRAPAAMQTWLIVGLAVLAGALTGLLLARYLRACGAALAVAAVASGLLSVVAYREGQYLANPLVPIFALLASGALVAFVRRQAYVRQMELAIRE